MPKQLAKLALRSALSAKFAANQLEVWHALDVGSHRTAAMTAILRQSNWSSVLFVDLAVDETEPTLTFTRVIANLPNAHIAAVADLNVYDILKRDNLVLSRRAAERLNVTLAPRFALPPSPPSSQT
jgi:large subunit ribosomal protein L4